MMHARSPGARGGATVALLFAIGALPMLLVRYPPVMDLPNHLARIQLLAGGLADPVLGGMYRADWSQASTNIGVDAVAVLLARALPLWAVSVILLLLMILGPALAGAALHRKIFGRWDPWTAVFLVTAWSTTAVAGFMSFQISLAAGLAAAALMADRLARPLAAGALVAHLAVSTALLVLHPFGLLLYLAAAAGLALGPAWPRVGRRRELRGSLASIAALSVGAAAPVALLFLLAPHPPGGESGVLWPDLAYGLNPLRIAKTLASPFVTYSYKVDGLFLVATGAAVLGALASPGRRVHWGLLLATAALGSGAVWAPLAIGDASWLQQRFAVMSALLLFAAIRPGGVSPVWRVIVVVAVIATALARVAWIGAVWMSRERDAEDLFALAQALPAGAAVIVVRQETPEDEQRVVGRYLQGGVFDPEPVRRHLPALLAPMRRVFVPTLFTVPGQHALAVRAAWRNQAVTSSAVPYPATLGTADPKDPYVRRWRRFDYLVLLGADEPTRHPLDRNGLTPVARRGFAALYRIEKR